jgi:hypothetical protein
VKEGGYFGGTAFTARNPLGLVAHAEHLARVSYLIRKVFGLPGDAIVNITAAGDDGYSGGLPESALLLMTRVTLLGARGHDSLRRRHQALVGLSRVLRPVSARTVRSPASGRAG